MKKLKKVLSLVLVLAMVFSFATTAFAAGTSYADDDQIQNTEAVQVMTGMGIINGKGDNLFAPTDSFLRSEASKIITYMKLGPAAAEALTGTTTAYTDVPADAWFAPFVKYATAQGIIAGNGDSTFEPEIDLSREAWLKMLLVTIGYDAEENGLVNTNDWETNAMVLAISSGLITAEEAKLEFNRDTAVLYAWHALNTALKGTKPTYAVTTAEGKTYTFDNVADAALFALGQGNDAAVSVVAQNTLGQQVYGLVQTPTVNELGRPITKYEYKTGDKKTVLTEEPVKVYTTAIKPDDLTKDLGKKAEISTIYVNGKVDTTTTDLTTLSGQGVLIEVYATKDPDKYIAAVIKTYAYKLTKNDIDEKKGEITVRTKNADYTVEATGYAKDDVVTFNIGRVKTVPTALNVTKVEGTQGKVTATNLAKGYIRVDGEIKYLAAALINKENKEQNPPTTGTIIYYTDVYGNIILSKEAPAVPETLDGYVYVIEMQSKNKDAKDSLFGEETSSTAAAKARVITTEGEITNIDLAIGQDMEGNWVYLQTNGKPGETGVEDMDEPASEDTEFDAGVYGYVVVDDAYVLVNSWPIGSVSQPDSAVTIVKDTLNTNYVASTKVTVVEYTTNEKGEVTGAAVSTYTPASFPERAKTLAQNGTVVVSNKNGSVAQVICFQAAEARPAPATYAIYLGQSENVTDEGQLYTFLVDGEKKDYYLKAEGEDAEEPEVDEVGTVYQITESTKKEQTITAVEEVESVDGATVNYCDPDTKTISVKSEEGTTSSYTLSKDCIVYEAKGPQGNEFEKADTVEDNCTVTLYTVTKDQNTEVVMIVITAPAE